MTPTSRRPRGARAVAAAVCLVGAAGLAACSTGSGTSLATVPSTPSGSSTTGATPSPTTTSPSTKPTASPTTSAAAANPSTSSAGYRPPGLTAEQQAVVTAYQNFWDMRAAAYGNAKVDPAAAGKYADAGAILDMQRYTAQQQQKGTHTVGQSTTNVLSVDVTGARAVLTDCFDDRSADVSDATGNPVEQPLGKTQFTTRFVKTGGAWKVTQTGQTAPSCTVPG